MRVYFNDLSVGSPEMSLNDNFDKVTAFFNLIAHLKKTVGVNFVIVGGRFNGLRLCDTCIAECLYETGRDFDRLNLLRQLGNYFIKDTDLDDGHIFTHKATGRSSVLLGNAHASSRPVVSFTFHKEFASPHIIGIIKDGRDASIDNLYDEPQDYKPSCFVSVMDCRPYNPTVCPLWNTEATKTYHTSIESELNSIKNYPERKISILSKCADMIAQLNGWEFDESVTKLNKNSNAFRRIYNSAKFTYGKGYLSIDFEKPEIYFELHDKRGRHLGEYCWTGACSKDADPKKEHNINVG